MITLYKWCCVNRQGETYVTWAETKQEAVDEARFNDHKPYRTIRLPAKPRVMTVEDWEDPP